MDDNLNQYCETIIRSPLPIFLRRNFSYINFILYLILQVYTCCQLAKWRLSQNQMRVNGSLSNETSDFGSISMNFAAQNLTNITAVENNLTRFVYDVNSSNASSNASSSLTMDGIAAEEIPPLYGHALTIPFIMIAFQILIFVCRMRYQSVYTCAIQYVNLIDINDVINSRRMRSEYQRKDMKLDPCDEGTMKTALTLREQSTIYKLWRTFSYWKPSNNATSISYPMIDCTLVDYMFSNLRYEGGYQIIGAIELLHEVMKAIDYLHYRNVYHLDLKPESVKLHCNGRKVYVKLTNFNFMKKSANRKITTSSVGARGFYRPLECSVEQELDAEKIDIWGLGMIALDLFTGGLYRIKSESGEWDEQRCEDLISTFTQNSSFSSYLEGAYGVIDMFTQARYHSTSAFEMRWDDHQLGFAIVTQYPYKTYNVAHTNFMYNIRCFVCRCLIFSPRRRVTLQRAFEEPLILNREFRRGK